MTPVVEPDPVAHGSPGWTRFVGALLVVVPALVVLSGGWAHRWVNEDAFINLRVVDQVFAGNGPVFNIGERVETTTSPLWLGVLLLVRGTLGLVLRMEWATVVTCLAAATVAFLLGGRASRLAHPDDAVVVPLGLALVAAVPVVWDFATSGLEMSLVWLWLSGAWLALLTAARAGTIEGWRRTISLVVLGVGPLVRPDLGLMSVCLLAGWLFVVRPTRRRAAADLGRAAAVPLAYQLFRMGYYAAVVPTTALAKDAGGLHLGQGVNYAADLARPYWLWLPLGLLGLAVARNLVQGPRPLTVAGTAMVSAAVLHAGYIVVVGGDYMHGRLLLPALVAVALPASVALRRQDLLGAGLVALGGVWAVACAAGMRYPQLPPSGFGVAAVTDFRALTPEPRVVPVEPDIDFLTGTDLDRLYERGERGFVRTLEPEVVVPTRSGDRLVGVLGSIGLPAYRAGIDVWIVDIGGLAEPLAARTAVIPGRAAGHRKSVDFAWYDARFGVEGTELDAAAVAASRALECPPLSGLLAGISEPLTPRRIVSNVWHSARWTRLHVPADPVEAERSLCGRAPDVGRR